ncbi:MAG: hypothetical protein QM785_18710 [Pyrinomonadaceae bacterium]
MLPFFATFAIGLFIASFFVSITPNFRSRGFGGRHKEMKRLRMENEMLRNENLRLKNQLDNQSMTMDELPPIGHGHFQGHGPEVPVQLDVPMPPPPPRHR